MFRFTVFASLLLTLLLAACAGDQHSAGENYSSGAIAEVGDAFTLYFPWLHSFYTEHEFGARYPDSELGGYQEAMEYLITNRLKQIDFFESGMYQNPDIKNEVARLVNEELEYAYFEEQYLSQYTDAQAMARYYEGIQKELHFRKIELPKEPGSMSSRQQAENSIEEILEALDEGWSFSRLISYYDVSSARTSQRLRGDIDRESPLFKQLYSLDEGDIKVVETAASFLVIKIDSVSQVNAPPLKEIREEVLRNLRQIYTPQAVQSFDEEKQRLIHEARISWNEPILERLSELSRQGNGTFFEAAYRNTVEEEINRTGNKEILNYSVYEDQDSYSLTYNGYIRLLDEVLIPESSRGLSPAEHKDFLIDALRRSHIADKARDMGLEKSILNAETASPELLSRAVSLFNRTQIQEYIPEPTQERLEAFYEIHGDSIFAEPDRSRAFIINFDTQEQAEQVWKRYESGTAFEELTTGYSVRSFTRDEAGNIRVFRSRETPYLGEEAFSMEEGDVHGPVQYEHSVKGTQYAILKIHSKQQAHIPELSELSETYLQRRFLQHHERSLARQVKDELWRKYPVAIYKARLRQQINML